MKKFVSLILAASMATVLFAGCGGKSSAPASSTSPSSAALSTSGSTDSNYPTHDVTGYVQWGAGGGTDNLMRPLASYTQNHLGVNLVVQNKTGASGAVATQFVHDQKADGYNLLMGAENPTLYPTLGTSQLTYDDFEPIILVGYESVAVIVAPDSPYNSITDLIEAAKSGEVVMATSGNGSSQWMVAALIKAVSGAEVTQAAFDGDAACMTAVMGGHVDFTTSKVQSTIEAHRAGTVKVLCTIAEEPSADLEGVKPIVEDYPEFSTFLPWGPFYGVFVKKGTPENVIEKLREAFKQGFDTPEYQELLASFNVIPLGTSGDEANTYIKDWQASAIKALKDAGQIK